jgi:putative zinc finger/helix-turn-helix YgiT family protein
MTCIKCRKPMVSGLVEFDETIRDKAVKVTFEGFSCPKCGFRAVDMNRMAEYGRSVSDAYRRSEGLLTSDEIRSARERLAMSQEAFADYLGVGIASVKRWELGQIQERSMDKLLRLMTDPVYAIVQAAALRRSLQPRRLQPSIQPSAPRGRVRNSSRGFSAVVHWSQRATRVEREPEERSSSGVNMSLAMVG